MFAAVGACFYFTFVFAKNLTLLNNVQSTMDKIISSTNVYKDIFQSLSQFFNIPTRSSIIAGYIVQNIFIILSYILFDTIFTLILKNVYNNDDIHEELIKQNIKVKKKLKAIMLLCAL